MKHPTSPRTPRRCSVDEFRIALAAPCQAIDVREPGEYESERIHGTRLAPLSSLERHLEALDRAGPLYVVCRSGKRAQAAADRLVAAGWHEVHVVEGGLLAWVAAGQPVVRGGRDVWSLERQVRMTAGALVFASVLGALVLSPWIAVLAGLVGGGLMVSAATDTCAMGLALARMPWNRGASSDACSQEV